jgi:hypothetical protein
LSFSLFSSSASEEILNKNIHVLKHTDLIKNAGAYEPVTTRIDKAIYPIAPYSRSVPTTPMLSENRFLSSALNGSTTVYNRNSRPHTPYYYDECFNDSNYFVRSSSEKYVDNLQPLPPIQTMYYDNNFRDFRTYDRILGIQTQNIPVDESKYKSAYRERQYDYSKYDKHDYVYNEPKMEKGKIYQTHENKLYEPKKTKMDNFLTDKNTEKSIEDLAIFDNENTSSSLSKHRSKKIALKIPKNAGATSNTVKNDEEIIYVPMKKSDFLRRDKNDDTKDESDKPNDFIILKEKICRQNTDKQHDPNFENYDVQKQRHHERTRDNSADSGKPDQNSRTIFVQTQPNSSFYHQTNNKTNGSNGETTLVNMGFRTDSTEKILKNPHDFKTNFDDKFTSKSEKIHSEAMKYERSQLNPINPPKKIVRNFYEVQNEILTTTGNWLSNTEKLCDESRGNKKIVFPELLNFTKKLSN